MRYLIPTIEQPKAGGSAINWSALLARYREPHTGRSIGQLSLNVVLFVGLWAAMYWSLSVSYLLTLALSVPTAFIVIRLFIIQHDCGHGAFLKSQTWADRIGGLIGVLSLTPYVYWRKTHALHHATSGNLEHRGFGDIDTLTVAEYAALPRGKQFLYRLYRHPVVLFFVGALIHFFVRHRLPTIVPRTWHRERRSILMTNLGLAIFFSLGILAFGFREFFAIWLPYTVISTCIGVWLFYVQHQFEPTYWEHDDRWEYSTASLEGSSYYVLPRTLQWLTGNIGLHHVHHLNPRIPNYRLQEALDANPELNRGVTLLTLWDSLRCVNLTLWDEAERKLISFKAARGRVASA